MSGPSTICVNNYGTYSAVDQFGTNYSWSVSPTSIFSLSSNSSSAYVNAYGEGSGVVILTYNRKCDNLLITERKPIYASTCGGGYYGATLSVSPNPSSDEVEISYADEQKDYAVKIYNSFNKVVAEGVLRKGKLRVKIGHLAQGIYVVSVLDEKRGIQSVRLAKK